MEEWYDGILALRPKPAWLPGGNQTERLRVKKNGILGGIPVCLRHSAFRYEIFRYDLKRSLHRRNFELKTLKCVKQ
jgi:hypothetical protein